MENQIDLIVGLGNAEARYLMTRHNAGFWFVDLLARAHGGSFRSERKLHSETAEISIGGHRIRLLKPTTYMNLSGRAVAAALGYYKIPLERLFVAYDEIDLPPGRVRLKLDGGAAGHNGLTSVIEHVGSRFWRLRLGVGHPGPGRREEVADYVLSRAPREEEELILESVAAAVDAMPVLVEQGAERAKNLLHARKPAPPADEGAGNAGTAG